MGVLGSIQVGSGKRFSSANKVADPFQPNVSIADIETPPAPLMYQGLKSGPDLAIEYEPNETPPIDGSASFLRTLSPFMFQVEPPMAYASQGANGKADFAKILQAGHGAAPAAFQAARSTIGAGLPDSQIANAGQSVESFVAQGFINRPKGPTGSQVMDLKGQGAGRIGIPAIADLYTAVDITMQLRALLSTPPLVLLINPTSLSMKYTKKQQYTERTRYGFVFQAWGEDQPRLSIEAKCGAFISGGRGVQWASRRDSASWQNLATAFQFYRHNGYIYDTVGKSNANHFVGALSIHYDQWVYYGNMESFTYSFDEAAQRGGVVFSMEFVVNAMVDTSKSSLVVSPMRSPIPSPSDPRYSGLGSRATQGTGSNDVVVGGDFQPVQFGPADNYTVTGVSRDGTATTPVLSQGSQLGSGLVSAPPGNQGFVRAPGVNAIVSAAAQVAAKSKKPAPFGIR